MANSVGMIVIFFNLRLGTFNSSFTAGYFFVIFVV